MWWFRTYSTLVQTYTYDLFFSLFWNNLPLWWNSLYIWSENYNHKVAGLRLFDHKKSSALPSCFNVVASCFFQNFFSLFVIFLLLVTFINYFLLLRKAKGIILLYLLHCLKGASAPWFFFYFFYCWRGGGWRLMFFSPLYIWSGHYAHKVAGWRLFDHQKPNVMPGYSSVMPGFFFDFFDFLFFFVTFFTTCNFCKLFFTVQGARWIVLVLALLVWLSGIPQRHNATWLVLRCYLMCRPWRSCNVFHTKS